MEEAKAVGRGEQDFSVVTTHFEGDGDGRVHKLHYAEAEPVLRTLMSYQFEDKPWLKPQTQSLLGACLAGQKKYAEAEPLLLSGYEGLRAGEAAIPVTQRKRVTEAL